MNRKNIYGDNCPVLYALNIIGRKWTLSILWHLKDSSLRYSELKRKLNGVTNIMLTRSLQDLEEYGLVNRIQHSDKPPHVEYILTENAKKLLPALACIQEWGKELLLMNKKINPLEKMR